MREYQNMSKCLHHSNYIASYLNYIATMGRERTFGDAGLVRSPGRVATIGGKGIREAPAGGAWARACLDLLLATKLYGLRRCARRLYNREEGMPEASYRAFSEYNTKIWR